jgi:3-hydroxypropanoate dehydrogenase
MRPVVDGSVLATLLKEARSHNGWLPDPVSEEDLEAAYEIAKWGPTSMNSQPMRVLFVRSLEAKERLKPALAPANVQKVMSAPVVAVIAYDYEFYKELPRTFPHNPNAQAYFTGNQAVVEPTAFRNSSLQAAYFMLALRAVGLDVGPMSGFDPAKVNAEFFAATSWRVNMLCGIGHGDHTKLFNRSPRLGFKDVAQML